MVCAAAPRPLYADRLILRQFPALGHDRLFPRRRGGTGDLSLSRPSSAPAIYGFAARRGPTPARTGPEPPYGSADIATAEKGRFTGKVDLRLGRVAAGSPPGRAPARR